MYVSTTATKKVSALSSRIRVVQGGTSASKTISILLYLVALSQNDKKPKLTSIVSESFPHLRRGALRDFLSIMKEHQYFNEDSWDKTNSIYTFETGSQIEFFSVDQGEKLRGARRDRLFINECNNVPFMAFEELEVRTKDFVLLDYNPTSDFWVFSEVLNKRNDTQHIILTYRDNEALSPQIVASIEQRKNRRGWYAVYGLGQLGEIEGKIYRDWAIIDEIPHEAKLERYGLDFGYSVDPTSIVAVYRYNNGFILDEILFQKGLSNKQIADTLEAHDKALVIADSAEPKSIAEIASFGINIVGCEKGRDSVRNGIQIVQDQRISVTKRSTNIINEYRNYLWETDANGKVLNIPEQGFDHSLDAIRYAIVSMPKVYSTLTPQEKEDLIFRQAMMRKTQGREKKRKGLLFNIFNKS
jgi:phage terminase large subunit